LREDSKRMDDGGWDLSDFVNKYTTKSTTTFSSSPMTKTIHHANTGGIDTSMDNSLQSVCAPSPSKMEKVEHDDVMEKVEHDDVMEKVQHDDVMEDVFCTADNLQERLGFLNQELGMHGFHSLFSRKPNSRQQSNRVEDLDLARLVSCTYELLRRQHLQAKVKDDLEERHLRSENDNEYLLQNQVRLKQDLENLKRESVLLLCREKEQVEKSRMLTQEVKAERDEKRKLKSDIEHLKKQFYHESKRTEKEISRLKEKVHSLLNDKSQERKFGIQVLNALQRADGKRSTWKTAGKKNEDEMYKMIISNFEDKEQQLLSENQAMRETLTDVRNQLSSVDTSIGSEIGEEESRQLQMPFFMVKTEVENKFQQIIANLRDRLENTTPKEQSPTKDEKSSLTINSASTDELQQRLEQCKAVITGQEAIIQELKEGYSQEAFERALLTFGLSEENYEASEKRLKKLKEEEEKLCEERKNFTDYVLKVSKEREEFEKERVEFYMHCISTPVLNKDKKLNARSGISTKHSLRMATPAFSPAPSTLASSKKERLPTSKQMPSTAELYRFMSLNYDGSVSRNLDRNLNGSFVQADTSPDGSPSPKKLHEHAENIRRAVEEHHNKSIEESVTELQKTPRSHTSSNTGFSGGEIPFYLME